MLVSGLFRLTSGRCCRLRLTLVRTFLTSSQTAEVLRPFIFAVHPDFFGNYPKEQAVNEYSLQQLYAHLECIRQENAKVTPKDLTFYLRNSSASQHDNQHGHRFFRPVTVTMRNQDIYTIVSNILETCSLSTVNLQQLSASRPVPFPRPVDWPLSYYAYTGKKNPKVEVRESAKERSRNSLRYWLKTNLSAAKKKQKKSLPIHEETVRLQDHLKTQLGLLDLRWTSGWDVNSFRSCLRILCKLHQDLPHVTGVLKGRCVVIGGLTGLSHEGLVMLSSKHVEQQWLTFLNSIPYQLDVLDSVSILEQQLSDQLGGVKLSRHGTQHSAMPVLTYHNLLRKLNDAIVRYQQRAERQRIGSGSMADVRMIISSDSGRMFLSPDGSLHVTASTQPPDLIKFLLENRCTAKEATQEHSRLKLDELAVIEACQEALDLAKLTKDDAVTVEEMILCCSKLLENPTELEVSLRNINVKICHIYTVLWDGELCIPWNWNY